MALGKLDRLDGLESVIGRFHPHASLLQSRENNSLMCTFHRQSFLDASPLLDDVGSLRQAAAKNGYLYLPNLIEPHLIEQLRARVVAVCQELGWLAEGTRPLDAIARPNLRLGEYDDPMFITLQVKVQSSPEFVTLGHHPVLLQVLRKLFCGPVATEKGNVCRVFAPGLPERTTPAHQDRFFVKGTSNLWTVWIPLGDCPVELGGLALLPGSHHQGLLAHTGEGPSKHIAIIPEDAVWATGDYHCGDVLMFNSLIVHRAGDNRTTNRLRISADYRYQPQDV